MVTSEIFNKEMSLLMIGSQIEKYSLLNFEKSLLEELEDFKISEIAFSIYSLSSKEGFSFA